MRELTKDLFNSKAISPDANLYEFKDRQAYREETKIRIKKLKEKIEAVGQDLNRDNSETHNESNKDIFQGKKTNYIFSYKRKYHSKTRKQISNCITKTFYEKEKSE